MSLFEIFQSVFIVGLIMLNVMQGDTNRHLTQATIFNSEAIAAHNEMLASHHTTILALRKQLGAEPEPEPDPPPPPGYLDEFGDGSVRWVQPE